MVRIREAYKQKIHLHINQGMLKRLWDKYVPADAAEYGNIDLFYLGSHAKGEEQQPGQAKLLISLVLKSRMMQMGLEEGPVRTAFAQTQMGNSLQRMERYYLTQLKCCDFVMYRNVNRFVELLDQAQAGGRRYKEWQGVSRVIEKQRDRYRLFSLFAAELKEFFTEHSRQTMRTAEKETLEILEKKEYQEFCRLCRREMYAEDSDREVQAEDAGGREVRAEDAGGREVRAEDGIGREVKWKKNKGKMRRFLEEAEDAQIRGLWVQLEHLAESADKQAESGDANALLFAKLLQIRHHYRQEVASGFWKHAFEAAGSKKFREAAELSGIPWKELESQFVREKKQQRADDIEYLEALKEINQSESGQEQYQADGKPEQQMTKRGELLSGESVVQFIEDIGRSLQAQREQLVQREAQAFVSYREIYREIAAPMFRQYQVDREKTQDLFMQIRKLQATERTALIEKLADIVLLQAESYPVREQGGDWRTDAQTVDAPSQSRALVPDMPGQLDAQTADAPSQSRALVSDMPGQLDAYGTETVHKNGGGVLGFTEKEIQQLLYYITSVMEKKAERIFAGHLPRKTKETVSHRIGFAEEETEGILSHRIGFAEGEKEGGLARNVGFAEREADALVHRTDRSGEIAKRDVSSREVMVTEKELLQIAAAAKRIAGKIASKQTASVNHKAEKRLSQLMEDAEQEAVGREAQDAGTIRERNEGIHIGAADVIEWEAEVLFRQITEVIEKREAEKISGYALEGIEEALSYISDKREEKNIFTLAEEAALEEAGKAGEALAEVGETGEILAEAGETGEILAGAGETGEILAEAGETGETLAEAGEIGKAIAEGAEKAGEEARRMQQGVSETAWIPYRQLWEWGEALLFHPEHGQEMTEAGILPGWQDADTLPPSREGEQKASASREGSRESFGNLAKEDIQTEIIRRQIAAAKSRNTLQQLIYQINHKTSSELGLSGENGEKVESAAEAWEKVESAAEAWDKEDAGREPLVFADSQLGTPQIRELLQFVQELDESQYGRLVEELSQVTIQQRALYFAQKPGGTEEKILEHLAAPENREVLAMIRRRDEKQYEAFIEKLSEAISSTAGQARVDRTPLDANRPGGQYLASAYPMLVYRIRQYEARRLRTIRENMQTVRQAYYRRQGKLPSGRQFQPGMDLPEEVRFQPGMDLPEEVRFLPGMGLPEEVRFQPGMGLPEEVQFLPGMGLPEEGQFLPGVDLSDSGQFRAGIHSSGEPAILGHRENAGNAWERISQTNDLQYSVQEIADSEEELQRERMRGQQENAQLMSAQEQLGRKLKEVEAQLEKVETAAKAKEDVQAFADQVKKQLYEELHVEKLRRGLI